MRIYTIFLLCLLSLLSLLTAVSFAQNSVPWLKADSLQITFLKQDITWDWQGLMNYSFNPSAGAGFYLIDKFNSDLLLPNREARKWRDENQLDGFFFYKSMHAYQGLYIRSWHLSDRQPQNYSQYGNHAAGFKAIYNLPVSISLQPYLGYQRSQNKKIIEWGWDLGLAATGKTLSLGSYRGSFQANTDYDFYDRRKNSNTGLAVNINAYFSPQARDSIALNYLNDDQQYFSGSMDKPVNVHIKNESLYNQLRYLLSHRSSLELVTILWSRNILDELPGDINKRNVFRFENRLVWRHYERRFILSLGANTFQEIQDNLGIRTDSKALQSGLFADMVYLLSAKNSLNLQLNLVKFQYDTPDSITNNDDRDELRFIGFLRYDHEFSSLLKAEVEAYANLFHKIYIFKEQSANNNWNRIYRLNAWVQYHYRNWYTILNTAVLANYTVYDFEKMFTIPRSFVFRKYSFSDSLLVPLLPRMNLGMYTQIELEDRGTFFEQEFSQQLVESSRSQYYDFFLRFKNLLALQIDLGVNLFQWDGWQHIPVRKKDREINRRSPYLRLAYPVGRRMKLQSSISTNFLNDSGHPARKYTTGSINLIYSF
jgi:hypothetical protein